MGDETRRRNVRDAIRGGMAVLLSVLLCLSMVPATAMAEPMGEEPLQPTESQGAVGEAPAQAPASAPADVPNPVDEATMGEEPVAKPDGTTSDAPDTAATSRSGEGELGTQSLEAANPTSEQGKQTEGKLTADEGNATVGAESVTLTAQATNPYSGGHASSMWTAWQLAYDRLGISLPNWGLDKTWYQKATAAGYPVGDVPRENAIAVWDGGTHLTDGHVAFVTQVNGSQMYVLEGNYNGAWHEGWVPTSGPEIPQFGNYYTGNLIGFIYLNNPPMSGIAYRTHVQNDGWQTWRHDGDMSGTAARSLRLEGINIKLEQQPYSGGIEYRTHVQNIGWQGWVANGAMSGTSGRSLRLEAIEIRLTGEMANRYDVYYRVHAQNIGWMGWAKNGGRAGSACHSYRLEAIQIVLVPKGGAAPGGTYKGITQNSDQSYVTHLVQYRTHVQNDGWQGFVYDGAVSGTSGRSLRLEAMNMSLPDAPYSGGIEYRTHVQNIGWQGWVANGAMSGTSGRSLRLEAMQVRLTGEMANRYDVWYRVHAQNIGWMGWAKNGASAGTAGYAYRLEAMQVRLVPKGGAAPGSTANAFREYDVHAAARDGAIAKGLQVFEGTVRIVNARQVHELNKQCPAYDYVPETLSEYHASADFDWDRSTYAVLMLDGQQRITESPTPSPIITTRTCIYILLGQKEVRNNSSTEDTVSRWRAHNGKRVCVAGRISYPRGIEIPLTAKLVNAQDKPHNGVPLYTL